MKKIIRYVIGLCCVLLLAHTCARAEEMIFDPIDVLTGHPVFERSHHNEWHHAAGAARHEKENSCASDHKQGKKYRNVKHISFELYFSTADVAQIFTPDASLVFTPTIPKHYRYLFFEEINPPPPRCC